MKRKIVVPERRTFRAVATPGEALAMDPGGAGLIASAIRGEAPSPKAWGVEFDVPRPIAFDAAAVQDGLAILRVEGPLEHHSTWWCANYEDIGKGLDTALSSSDVRGVAMKIDSPGGVASGMCEIHDLIRALQKKHSKPVYAYADGMACSAAYNIASACREVWTSEDGILGSIGVILCTVDESKRLEKEGYAIRYVVTGERKADMHPGSPITDEVLKVAQAKVDYLGALFFRNVGRARSMKPSAVQALQAGVFYGPEAQRKGLADGVATWAKFVALTKKAINAGATPSTSAPRASRAASARRG